MVKLWAMVLPFTSSMGSWPRGVAVRLLVRTISRNLRLTWLEAEPLLLGDPLVLVLGLSLGQDQPGQLRPPLQVEVSQLDRRHDERFYYHSQLNVIA